LAVQTSEREMARKELANDHHTSTASASQY
jgi:hypothetical protein